MIAQNSANLQSKKSGRSHSVSILGLGYVGLCTATVFANKGVKTLGIDIDKEKIVEIARGRPPFHEPRLEPMLKTALRQKRLEVTTDASRLDETGTTFITVGTPSNPDGSINLSYVKNATQNLGSAISDKKTYHLVVVKSTVIPGTTTRTVKPVLEASSGKTVGYDIGLCANPEFLAEGNAIQGTLQPDRIIIGANDQKSARTLKQLYTQLYKRQQPPTITTTPETAEMVKYANNAFLATKVSYINTIANICQQTPGVDVKKVAEAIGLDPRIGPLFLNAGPGYGGSCFHKDLQALIHYSQSHGYDPDLLRATEDTNDEQASRVISLSEKLLGVLKDRKVAVLGLAFKKDTDDIREAASVRVIHHLQNKGAKVVAYDPMATPNAKKLFADSIEYAQDPHSALKGADCCIIMTEWDQFKKLRPKDYTGMMRVPNIVDARKLYDPEDFKSVNFVAIGLGS
jgi:UDPglucose 6-dehydrogenase